MHTYCSIILTRSPTWNSRCAVDCLQHRATSIDLLSISRKSRLVSLECESYSLAIESDSDRQKSVSGESMSRASKESESSAMAATSTATRGMDPSITGSIAGEGSASVGAAAGGIAPETMSWVDRPTPTGQVQLNGGGVLTINAARRNVLLTTTVILTLLSVFQRA